ncbi:uncharacterized protein BX663DRAFT_413470, partial [Cokeromyces recurvatus]|uniref:uncharacterized protein n=1 Tax=Cokeromyces recurvatus TaxID=90255 RepID=UPI0022206894
QRPYKILISLMDKWELGQPIVSNIFVDCISSLESIQSGHADIMKTANMWINMVEPHLICMKLYELIDISFPGVTASNKKVVQNTTNSENIHLVEFTLDIIHFTDDEVKHIHLPLILAALTKKLNNALKSPNFIENLSLVSQGINLILQILEQLPDTLFLNRSTPPMNINKSEESSNKNGLERKQFQTGMNIVDYTREFYGIGQPIQQLTNFDREDNYDLENEQTEEGGDLSSSINMKKSNTVQYIQYQTRPEYDPLRGQLLVKEVADNLTSFLVDFVNSYIILPENLLNGVDVGVEGKRLKHIEHYLERVFLGVCTAIAIIAKYADKQFILGRQEQLTHTLLKCCQQVKVFGIVDAALSTLTVLLKQKQFVDLSVLKQISQVKDIVDKLWGFLTPLMQLLHVRTVELLWLLIDVSLPHQIETIISNYLIQQDNEEEKSNNYEKFGIIWELSENVPEASNVFSRPLFIMLDLLRDGASPSDRRAGDLWIRCHLKSYARLLEPFILTLLSKHILRRPAELEIEWKNQILKKKATQTTEDKITKISYFFYIKPFDAESIDYMFTTLITLITFGGLNVLKSCKYHTIDNESSIAKAARVSFIPDMDKPTKLLDLLVMITIR